MTDMDSVRSSSERSNSQRRASKKTDGGGQWQSTPQAPTSRVKVDVSKPSPSSEPQGEMKSSLPPPGTTAAVKPNRGQQHLGLLTSWGSTQFDFNRSTEGFFIMCERFIRSLDYHTTLRTGAKFFLKVTLVILRDWISLGFLFVLQIPEKKCGSVIASFPAWKDFLSNVFTSLLQLCDLLISCAIKSLKTDSRLNVLFAYMIM